MKHYSIIVLENKNLKNICTIEHIAKLEANKRKLIEILIKLYYSIFF